MEQGGFAFAVILHEFGHAHGLAHRTTMAAAPSAPGVSGPFDSYGLFDLNQGVYTVMSYNDAWHLHPDGAVTTLTTANIDNGWSATLSAFDIAVLQERYGVHDIIRPPMSYALTDNVDNANFQCIGTAAASTRSPMPARSTPRSI